MRGEWGGASREDRGHPRAAGGGWPRREQLCTSRPREDEGQLSDLCGRAQDCFKAGRMEPGGVDREREGTAAGGKASEDPSHFHEGEQNLSFPSCSSSYQRI